MSIHQSQKSQDAHPAPELAADGSPRGTVLLTGATGFVGESLYPALRAAGYAVVCASRRPEQASQRYPDRRWIGLDLGRPDTVGCALHGCDSAFYLVHEMAAGETYIDRERQAALHFGAAADAARLRRVVYLGGVMPTGQPSPHLESRLRTGAILRSGRVSTIEVRAAMIIGARSVGFRMVRDLALRLPVMVLPRWLHYRSRPVAIDDMVAALLHALALPGEDSACYDAPGLETMTHKEVLDHVAALAGLRPPLALSIPLLTPGLSTAWISLVTRCDSHLTRELVQGLLSDLLPAGEGIFAHMPHHRRLSFDEAVRLALADEDATVGTAGHLLEGLVRLVAGKANKGQVARVTR